MAAADRGLSQRINNGPPSAVSFDAIPDAAADLTIPARQRKTIFELTADTCRWPVGTPGHPGFFFCGGATGGDLYCPAHACRAFNGFGGRRGAPLAAGFARDTR
jgi:GcrA cell cycle regulator